MGNATSKRATSLPSACPSRRKRKGTGERKKKGEECTYKTIRERTNGRKKRRVRTEEEDEENEKDEVAR